VFMRVSGAFCVPACGPTETGFGSASGLQVLRLQGFRISHLPNYEPEGRGFECLRARHLSYNQIVAVK